MAERVYAFDVDHTLEVSGGPVSLGQLLTLWAQGNIVGLCGNWAAVTASWTLWPTVCSFIGPMGISKVEFLKQIQMYVPVGEYILVGNDPLDFVVENRALISNDVAAAAEAGWRFIPERQFALGVR